MPGRTCVCTARASGSPPRSTPPHGPASSHRIRLTLEHILLVDLYYLDGLVRGGRGQKVRDDVAALDGFVTVRAAQAQSDARLVAFVAGLADDAALDAIVDLERKEHVQREKVGDVLMHLFQHQIHHRGQVHAMLADTHVRPPQLDEFFMAEEAPLRESELRAARASGAMLNS